MTFEPWGPAAPSQCDLGSILRQIRNVEELKIKFWNTYIKHSFTASMISIDIDHEMDRLTIASLIMNSLENLCGKFVPSVLQRNFEGKLEEEDLRQFASELISAVPGSIMKKQFSQLLDYEELLHDGTTEIQYLNYFRLAHLLGTTKGYFFFTPKTLPVLSQISYNNYKEVHVIEIKDVPMKRDEFDEDDVAKVYKSFTNVEIFVCHLNEGIFYKFIPKYMGNLKHFYNLFPNETYEEDKLESMCYLMGLEKDFDFIENEGEVVSSFKTVTKNLISVTFQLMDRDVAIQMHHTLKIFPNLQQIGGWGNDMFMLLNMYGRERSDYDNVSDKFNLRKLSVLHDSPPPEMCKIISKTCPKLRFIEVFCRVSDIFDTSSLEYLLELKELEGIRLLNVGNDLLIWLMKKIGRNLKGLSLCYSGSYKEDMPFSVLIEAVSLCPNLELFQMYSRQILLQLPNEKKLKWEGNSLTPNLKYLSVTCVDNDELKNLAFLFNSPALEIIEINTGDQIEGDVYVELMKFSCWKRIHTLSQWNFLNEDNVSDFCSKCPKLTRLLERNLLDINGFYLTQVDFDDLITAVDWWKTKHFSSIKSGRYSCMEIK